jgi:sugar transferase (PEP-CTERM system associated)
MLRVFGHHIALPVALLAFCDLCLFLFGLLLATGVYPKFSGVPFHAAVFITPIVTPLVAALAAINLACLVAAGLYKRDAIRVNSTVSRYLATAMSLAVVSFAAFIVPHSWLYGYRFSNVYAVALSATCFQLVLSFFLRAIVVSAFDVVGFKRRLLLLGEGPFAAKVEAWLAKNDPGYTHVIHYDSFRRERVVPLRRSSVLMLAEAERPSAMDLPQLAKDHRIDEIVVATGQDQDTTVWDLLECRTRGVRVIDCQSFWEREAGRIELDAIEPRWLVYSGGFRNRLWRRLSQRSLDVVVSLLGLAIIYPLMPIIALAIWVDSPGPIFYRQERIGKDDEPFQIFKFRTMCTDAEPDDIPRCAEINDARVTRVGKILRRMRIDEIPQLLNVLRGEMSIVGPRPERPSFVQTFRQQIPFYGIRHSVRPGITGWAQINYEYTASLEDTKRKLEYDLFYVKNHSLFLNLAIVLQTLRIILWQHGAR